MSVFAFVTHAIQTYSSIAGSAVAYEEFVPLDEERFCTHLILCTACARANKLAYIRRSSETGSCLVRCAYNSPKWTRRRVESSGVYGLSARADPLWDHPRNGPFEASGSRVMTKSTCTQGIRVI